MIYPFAFDANFDPIFVGDDVGFVDDPEPWDTYEVAEIRSHLLVQLTTLGAPILSARLRLLKDLNA